MAVTVCESRSLSGLFFVGLAAAVAIGGSATSVRAESALTEVEALARPFGVGVHAYFSGDSQSAYDDLTQAIEAGTRDPRAWYFRGLAALKLGRLDEAEADFSTAAARETESAGDWAVSRSLERVQGRDRLALERHRIRARVARYERGRKAVESRYSQIESRQEDVLRRRRPEAGSPDTVSKFGVSPPSAPEDTAPPAERPEELLAPAASEPEPKSEVEIEAEAPAAVEPAEAGATAPDATEPVELQAEREAAGAEDGAAQAMTEDGDTPPSADAPGGDAFGK